MIWKKLEILDNLNMIVENSFKKPQIIFKHSTRCSISSTALNRMDNNKVNLDQNYDCYLLDLIKYRDISNKIASLFNIEHESPQVLVIKDGKCIKDFSHLDIYPSEI